MRWESHRTNIFTRAKRRGLNSLFVLGGVPDPSTNLIFVSIFKRQKIKNKKKKYKEKYHEFGVETPGPRKTWLALQISCRVYFCSSIDKFSKGTSAGT